MKRNQTESSKSYLVFIYLSVFTAFIFAFSPLYSFQDSQIFALDRETGDTIRIFNVEVSGRSMQVVSPYMCRIGDNVRVYLIGYRDTSFTVSQERIIIYLEKSAIEIPPLTITENGLKSGVYTESSHGETVNKMIYSFGALQVKRYGRTLSYSVNGLGAEQTGMLFNGFPVKNGASGIIDPYLIPGAAVESIRVSSSGEDIYSSSSPLSGSVNFFSPGRDGVKTFLSSGLNGLNRVSSSASYRGFLSSYDILSCGDMVLSDGSILQNSFKESQSFSASFKGDFIEAGWLGGNSRTGDFGTAGSFFDSSTVYQNMSMVYAGLNNGRLHARVYRTKYSYKYDCRDLGTEDSSITSSSTADFLWNQGYHSAGFSISSEEAAGSRIGQRERIISSLSYSYTANSCYINLKASSAPQGEFTGAWRFNQQGFSAEAGVKRRYREPTFNELYWAGDRFASGNEHLESELLHSAFFSFSKQSILYTLKNEGGINMFSNLIEWTNTGSLYTPVNIATVVNPYLICDLTYRYGGLTAENSIIISPYIDLDEKGIVPYKPVLTYRLSAGFIFAGFSFSADASFKTRRYINPANTKFFPEEFILDRIGAERKIGKVSAGVECTNPLNSETEDVRGYPVEGRSIIFHIRTEVL